jgi:hypothetical protein
MIIQCFTVFDSKVGAYNFPFQEHSTGAALRAFIDAIEDTSSALNKHPEDYTLFHIGSYDNATAKFEIFKTPTPLGVALELKAQNQNKK